MNKSNTSNEIKGNTIFHITKEYLEIKNIISEKILLQMILK